MPDNPDRRVLRSAPARISRSSRASSVSIAEVIPDGDHAERIEQTDLFPWRMICALECTFALPSGGARKELGTGWLAGPRTVLTAAHNVFQPALGGFAKEVLVEPAHGSDSGRIGQSSTQVDCLEGYRQSQDPDLDIGVVHLDVGYPDLGSFTFAVLEQSDADSLRISVSGYPSESPPRRLLHHTKDLVLATATRLFYRSDTLRGQSGSPAWAILEGEPSPCVVGVHGRGTDLTPSGLPAANSAVRITDAIFSAIRHWVEPTAT